MKFIRNSTRITAFVMCVVLLAALCSSCSWYDEIDTSYTGTTLVASLGDMPFTFDPMYAYLDESSAQFLSLIYSGLFRYDENGKPQKDMCDSYEWIKNDDESGEYIAEFTIKSTAWSDTVSLTSKDFIFAWRRILNPGNDSPACSLLYDIKNARQIRTGEKVIYELGVQAVNDDTIRIEFEHKVNLDEFIGNLASPALVPLREDIVDKIDDWSTTAGIVVANGPFYLKTFRANDQARFERNRNYLRDTKADNMDKYVTPYRVVVYFGKNYTNNDTDEVRAFDSIYELNNTLWKEGELKYYSSVGAEYVSELSADSSFTSTTGMNTHTYVFNTANPLFSDARVRRALSLAIDRAALLKECSVLGVPAKGIVPDGVFELGYAKNATEFRSAGSDLIGSANLDEAKSLLKEAGVVSGSFTIKVRSQDETAIAAAEYVANVWNSLGFNVTVSKVSIFQYDNKPDGYDGLIEDRFMDQYMAGDFDVIAVDIQQISNSAFSALAPYATGFCGTSIDLSVQQDEYHVTHISGYDSAEYDEIIEKAYAATDSTEKAKLLHEAEELLMKDMPIIPLFTFSDILNISSDIKGVSYDYFGVAIFTEMYDKTFEYTPAE